MYIHVYAIVCVHVHTYYEICNLKRYFDNVLSFRLGYANAADVIELKGRVACEIDT